MSDELRLRRHLYELLAGPPRRRRRMFRRQLKVLATVGAPVQSGPEEPDGGTAGVREPRRPLPPSPPAARALPLP